MFIFRRIIHFLTWYGTDKDHELYDIELNDIKTHVS